MSGGSQGPKPSLVPLHLLPTLPLAAGASGYKFDLGSYDKLESNITNWQEKNKSGPNVYKYAQSAEAE